jgi:acetoin utilization protein AcuB
MHAPRIGTPSVVADIMSKKPVTLYEEDDIEKIRSTLAEFLFRHIPVVDDGKLVGLVTKTDLLAVSSSRLDPTAGVRDETVGKSLFVRDVMTADVKSVRPDTPIAVAARLMRDEQLGCLPVTDADGRLVGIVTDTDMLSLIVRLLETPG